MIRPPYYDDGLSTEAAPPDRGGLDGWSDLPPRGTALAVARSKGWATVLGAYGFAALLAYAPDDVARGVEGAPSLERVRAIIEADPVPFSEVGVGAFFWSFGCLWRKVFDATDQHPGEAEPIPFLPGVPPAFSDVASFGDVFPVQTEPKRLPPKWARTEGP